MDTDRIRQLAESAERRAHRIHAQMLESSSPPEKAGPLNDYFYWIGHANAYKGIVAMIELQTVVEDELDSESTCP